jgi:hypothetical protein
MRCACIEDIIMLGDILARLTDETTAVEMVLGTGDLALLAAVREQAAAEGLNLAACVTQTVQRYATTAADEEWVTLMGMLNRTQNPGTICLQRAFAYARQWPS